MQKCIVQNKALAVSRGLADVTPHEGKKKRTYVYMYFLRIADIEIIMSLVWNIDIRFQPSVDILTLW